jgi:hypothetical protein
VSRGRLRATLVRSLGAVALSLIALPLTAQHSRTLNGRVLLQRNGAPVPLADRVVTLHRVGSDSAGAVDSVRSDARGRYGFTFRPFGAEGAVYFAAVLHGGVAYFTSPLGSAPANAESTEIVVFDTASTGIDIAVRGRHLAISAPNASGARSVLDVFELGNDSLRTLVQGRGPGGEARATWRIALPEGIVNAAVMRDAGDIAGAAVTLQDGQAAVFAPFAPGIKQLALRYELPPARDSLTIPLIEPTGVLEVLLEEPGARASGAGVAREGAVTVEGRSLERYLAQNVAPSAVVTIALPPSRASTTGRSWWLALLGAAIAAVLGVSLLRRNRHARREGLVAPPEGAA